ncbi:MAG: UDP-N-acetylglucosamine 2-epimerase (non-hydrolyzing) [Planctomycetes bacterium]|nr:UDP-N-acetylglucosamine 2-epimerase (non-hydrolyzing) [Planctomycetota bacterium]
MRILTIVGARPQFVKAAPVSAALRRSHEEVLLHTGQHYDELLSDVFFRELSLPPPDIRLEVGSGGHGEQTGRGLVGIERAIRERKPDMVLVYGDTNATLSGALAAAKARVPLAHIEAGLRSFNRRQPEEVNRVVADRLSDLLLCPTQTAVDNLGREGLSSGVHRVGDVMLDALRHFRPAAEARPTPSWRPQRYFLATIHRAENADDPERLRAILAALAAAPEEVLLPVHPRTRKALPALGIDGERHGRVRLLEPQGYLDMLALEAGAALIVTDSGGVQKEAYFLGVPCVTLRNETEWVETVASGWNLLAAADEGTMQRALNAQLARATGERAPFDADLFGAGDASTRIAGVLEAWAGAHPRPPAAC